MRTRFLTLALVLAPAAAAHDLFLELARHRLDPNSAAAVALVNGTFGVSDNVITRDRMIDVSIVGPGRERLHPPATAWRDRDETSWLDFTTGGPGTYVLGVSTRPRVIELDAEAFHDYLRHDGVLDVLEQRERDGLLGEGVRERYSKHVKAVAQCGVERTDAFLSELGYPIEIVPLDHPDALAAGDELRLRVLKDGAPLRGQLVYASHVEYHEHDDGGAHVEAFSGRTDDDGVVAIPVDATGRWYARLIHMTEAPEEDVDYESLWATLTFEVHASGGAEGAATFSISLVAVAVLVALGLVVLVVAMVTGAQRGAG